MLYAFHNNLLPLGFWNSAQVRLRRNVAPLAKSRPNLFLELVHFPRRIKRLYPECVMDLYCLPVQFIGGLTGLITARQPCGLMTHTLMLLILQREREREREREDEGGSSRPIKYITATMTAVYYVLLVDL